MATSVKRELSPEEIIMKEKVDTLMEKVNKSYGEPLQIELAERLEKTVSEFHEDVDSMIEQLKAKNVDRRNKLKELWEHRNDEISEILPPEDLATEETSFDESVQDERELSAWEKKLEGLENEGEFNHNQPERAGKLSAWEKRLEDKEIAEEDKKVTSKVLKAEKSKKKKGFFSKRKKK